MFLYLGPGMSGGLLAAVLGILLSIIGGFLAIVWFPIKRMIQRKKKVPNDT